MTKKSWSLIALTLVAAVVLMLTAGGAGIGLAAYPGDGVLPADFINEVSVTGITQFALTSVSPGAGGCPGEDVCVEGKAWMPGLTAGDANGDGIISWTDVNGNGIADTGEYETVEVLVPAEGASISVQMTLERVFNVGSSPTNDVRYEVSIGTATVDSAGNWSVCGTIPTTVTRTSDYMVVDTPAGDWNIVVNTQDSVNMELGFITVLDCGQAPEPGVNVAGVAVSGGALPKTGFPVAASGILAGLMTSAGVGIRMIRRGR